MQFAVHPVLLLLLRFLSNCIPTAGLTSVRAMFTLSGSSSSRVPLTTAGSISAFHTGDLVYILLGHD